MKTKIYNKKKVEKKRPEKDEDEILSLTIKGNKMDSLFYSFFYYCDLRDSPRAKNGWKLNTWQIFYVYKQTNKKIVITKQKLNVVFKINDAI